MEELRIILSNKLHQLNLKQEHLMVELEKIKELSNTYKFRIVKNTKVQRI